MIAGHGITDLIAADLHKDIAGPNYERRFGCAQNENRQFHDHGGAGRVPLFLFGAKFAMWYRHDTYSSEPRDKNNSCSLLL
jgi:hypothetical protein